MLQSWLTITQQKGSERGPKRVPQGVKRAAARAKERERAGPTCGPYGAQVRVVWDSRESSKSLTALTLRLNLAP